MFQCRIRIDLPYRHPNRGLVEWGLYLTDDIAARHSPQPIACADRRGCDGALPLPNHVVRLVSVQRGPIGDVGPGRDEGADVSNGHLGGLGQSEHEEASDNAEGIEDDEGATEAQFVGRQGGHHDRDHGVVVGL